MTNKSFSSLWSPALAGFFSLFIGIGIARLAYTPILPALIQHHWMTHSQAGYLGATNFAGYLIGAFIARWPTKYIKHQTLIYINLLMCVISLAACAWDGGQLWLNTWRFLSGLSGAFLMVLTPAVIYASTPHKRKGLVGGIMFTGIGVGGVFCGLALPSLLTESISLSWLTLATFATLISFITWLLLPKHSIDIKTPKTTSKTKTSIFSWPLVLLISAYTLYGIAAVPHSLFIVEYIANYLQHGNHLGGIAWSLFGVGMIIGTLLIGFLSDHLGKHACLLGAYFTAFIALLILLISNHLSAIYVSTFLMGSLYLSLVALTSSRLSELVPTAKYTQWWGYTTGGYAIAQATAGYGMSYLLKFRDGYTSIFSIGALAFLIAFSFIVGCVTLRKIKRI